MALPTRDLKADIHPVGDYRKESCSPLYPAQEADAMAAKTLLCIDDEPNILTLRQLMLRTAGYRVLVATSGNEGIQLFRSDAIDCVILDYLMPEMNGEATARALRRIQASVPIVMVSACLSVPDRVMRLINVFLSKAEPPEMLLQVLRLQLTPAA